MIYNTINHLHCHAILFLLSEAIPSIITLVDHMTSLNFGRTLVVWIIYLSDKNLAWGIWRSNYRPPKYGSYNFEERTGSESEIQSVSFYILWNSLNTVNWNIFSFFRLYIKHRQSIVYVLRIYYESTIPLFGGLSLIIFACK